MKRLIIEQLKEGFIFLDEVGEKYAVGSANICIKVKAYFGLTDCSKRKKIKNNIAPPAKMQGSKTPDSHSGGATSNQDVRLTPPALTSEKSAMQATGAQSREASVTRQSIEVGAIHLDDVVMHPSDLKIAKFDYDDNKMQKYKSLEFWELPDGRVVLEYGQAHYYTSKEVVMQIPFPFPRKYFNKENGWSSSVGHAFKTYRRYLAEWKEPEGQTDGTCDDVSFDTCANNDPKICKFCINESRYEDKRKIAARKPGASLLKASMGL